MRSTILGNHLNLERLNFVCYHAVIDLPQLIIGYNPQKVTGRNSRLIVTRGPFLEPCEQSLFCQRSRFCDISYSASFSIHVLKGVSHA